MPQKCCFKPFPFGTVCAGLVFPEELVNTYSLFHPATMLKTTPVFTVGNYQRVAALPLVHPASPAGVAARWADVLIPSSPFAYVMASYEPVRSLQKYRIC